MLFAMLFFPSVSKMNFVVDVHSDSEKLYHPLSALGRISSRASSYPGEAHLFVHDTVTTSAASNDLLGLDLIDGPTVCA